MPRKEHNPAVPISANEQIESTQQAFEAGASLVHIHVRNDDGSPSSDPERFARVQEGVRKHCAGIIVQFSTGGRSGKGSERGGMLKYKPDMASLTTGSVNFPNMIYENPPALIDELASTMLAHGVKPEVEIFDMSMLFTAADLVKRGLLKPPVHLQFVMGVKNAMPADREVFEFYLSKAEALLPGATWTGAGVARDQLTLNRWSLELGGHCRTGLEDNIRYDSRRLAASNAELVARVAELCAEYGRPVATPAQARAILSLPAG